MNNELKMPSKSQVAQLVRDAVDPELLKNTEAFEAFVDQDEDLKKMQADLAKEMVDETGKVVASLTDMLAKLHLGASMAIQACRKQCGIDPESTDESLELLAMPQYVQAKLVINQVNEVNRQTAFKEYVAQAGLVYDVATNINFVERQFEQFKGAIRTYKLKGTDFEAAMKYARKHKDHPIVKARIATLYALLRFFNEIRAQRQVKENMLYITHTSALINAIFSSQLDIPLLSQIPALIINAENTQ